MNINNYRCLFCNEKLRYFYQALDQNLVICSHEHNPNSNKSCILFSYSLDIKTYSALFELAHSCFTIDGKVVIVSNSKSLLDSFSGFYTKIYTSSIEESLRKIKDIQLLG